MQHSFTQFIVIILLVIIIVLPVISQEVTPEVDVSSSPTLSPTPTASLTPSIEHSVNAGMQERSPTPSPTIAEITAEITPELTASSEETAESTEVEATTAAAEMTEAAEATEVVAATEGVEATEVVELTAEVSETSAALIGTATPGGYTLRVLNGEVHYQNRTEQTGITVSVFDTHDVLLSVAETNTRGVFSIAVPADADFILLIEAPLHQSIRLEMLPGEALPSLTLFGGDLNNDDCINQDDLDLLLADYETIDSPESDINADGNTNLSDLAILTGNYQAECSNSAESAETEE
jgi:hypothetical protein